MKKSVTWRLFCLVCLLLAGYGVSCAISRSVDRSDFPASYYAAQVMLDENRDSAEIYETLVFENASSVEKYNQRLYFIYSVPAAYVLAPFGMLPYYHSKSALIMLNLLAYLLSVTLILKALGPNPGRMVLALGVLSLWMPLLNNLAAGQVNAILLLIVVAAIYTVRSGYPGLGGSFFAAAALFKLFPLVIALVVGVRYRAVFLSSLAVFAVSFMLPGAPAWIEALLTLPHKKHVVGTTPAFTRLAGDSFEWFAVYVLLVTATVAGVILWRGIRDEMYLASVGQVTAFLVMPVVEYHHLVLLAVPALYLAFSGRILPRGTPGAVLALVPLLLINLDLFVDLPLGFYAVLYLWVVLLAGGVAGFRKGGEDYLGLY